jgi:predicted nucleic acid-binding protein
MTLVDAGPLVAVIDATEEDHQRCINAVAHDRGPYFTTWPIIGEAMHILGVRIGWPGQSMLLRMVSDRAITIPPHTNDWIPRIGALMQKYQDTPMDFADAALVVLAEDMNDRRILTLDSDFRVYRFRGRAAFELML